MKKMVLVNVAIDIEEKLCGQNCRFLDNLDRECLLFHRKLKVLKDLRKSRCKPCMEIEEA